MNFPTNVTRHVGGPRCLRLIHRKGNITMRRLIILYVFILILQTSLAQAAERTAMQYRVQVRAEKEDAIYRTNEKILFNVRVLQNGKPLETAPLKYHVVGDGGDKKEGALEIGSGQAQIECSLPHPGLILCTVSFQDSEGKTIVGYGGAAVAPQEIRDSRPEPPDFDEFWKRKKEELERLPMNPKLVPIDVEKYEKEGVNVFDLTVDCIGGKPLRAYLIKPVGAKKGGHPIFINYHGAGTTTGSYVSVALDAAKRGAIALDVNAHGIENGQPPEHYKGLFDNELKGYSRQNPTDREKYYFLGMYLRVFRSLAYMKSLPEWDGKTMAVRGNSQGGGQALVAAGSDPQVTVCRATVPALCYPLGYLDGNFGGWPNELRGKTAETADPAIVQTLPYFDAALFAKRIKGASCFVSTGFIDRTCSPTSVYVAYNNIPTKKAVFPTPTTDHSVPRATTDAIEKLFWETVFP